MPILPIVGSKYRPPAKAILSILPHGQELELRPEPENVHDPRAIAIWIDGGEINTSMTLDEVESILQGQGGLDAESLTLNSWHLGYLPRGIAVTIHLDGPLRGKLCFGSNGGPKVEFNLGENK